MSDDRTALLYRMVLPDHTCPFGVRAKELLAQAGYEIDDRLLTSRAQVDAFQQEHGGRDHAPGVHRWRAYWRQRRVGALPCTGIVMSAGTRATHAPATTPGAWLAIAKRAWARSSHDNIGLIAAGVGFYGFLALVPLLGATVLTYGLFASAAVVARHVGALFTVLPQNAASLIAGLLDTVVKTSADKKGLGLVVALALALFGARNAAGAVITALNVAYEQDETRGFVRVNLLALAITAAAVATFVIGAAAVGAVGYLHIAFPSAAPATAALSKIASSLVLVVLAATVAAGLYRFGPSGEGRHWRWLSPGAIVFALTCVVLTAGFGFYAANFGHYGATYGSLGAGVVLLTWLYLSAYALLFGAELNRAIELPATAPGARTAPAHPAGGSPKTPAARADAKGTEGDGATARTALGARVAQGQAHLRARLAPVS